jgi:2-methylcitrate dehydratase PrpD
VAEESGLLESGDGSAGLDRRAFIARGAAASGGLAALMAAPGIVREAYGEPLPVPDETRSVEAGLTLFTQRWQGVGAVIAVTRFGQFVTDKVFNCRVADQPRSYVLRIGSGTATLNPGIDPFRHADMILTEADWLGLLYGDFTGLAPFVHGGMYPSRDGANKVALLGILMHTFAHFPAGSNPPDPELLTRVLVSFARHGLPECEGEVEITEEITRMRENPEQTLRDAALPPASAPPVTRRLAEFVAGLRYEDLPPGTVESAKEQILSIVGAMYAGSRMAPGRKFTRAVRGFGDRPEATVIGRTRFRTSARHAALLNSVHAQVLEWEDWTFIAHSGASIVPAALAAGELGRASGRDLIAAVVAANEILARSGEVLTDVLHTGNAVPTHQLETPLVAGRLLGLDVPRLQDALGIACVQPQVTSIPAWTADAKGLLTGWPVMTGVEAALYARAGITGRRDIVESPGGYAYRVSDIGSPRKLDRLIEGLGEKWRFDREHNELFSKRYPTDGFQLTAVQAVLDLVNAQAKDVFDSTPRGRLLDVVERLQVRIPWVMAATATMFTKGTKDIYERIRTRPDWTYIALLFDGKYPLAAALVERRLTFREYERRTIFDPVVQAMIDKVELVPDLAMGVFGAEARLELADGRSFESRQQCIAEFPVREKLEVGARGILSRGRIRAIARAVRRLERYDDVRDFMKVVAPGAARR